MRRNVYCWLMMLCVGILVSCAKDTEVMLGGITGAVSDAANGMGIAGATVSLSPSGQSKTTATGGLYEFVDLEPAAYTLTAMATGYETVSKTVQVVAGQGTPVYFTLSPTAVPVSVSPNVLSFGPEVDKLSFTIRNEGSSVLQYSISDYPAYLTVNPASAQVAVKGQQAVTVSVNRNAVTSDVSTMLVVNVGSDSYPVSININVQNVENRMNISPSTLDFGEAYSQLQFTIKNVGTGGDLAWTAGDPTNGCFSVAPKYGTLPIGSSAQLTVTLDRSKMTEDIPSAFINVSIEGGSQSVILKAKMARDPNSPDTPGTPDVPDEPNAGEVAVKNGLVAYYRFENNFDDSSSRGNDGYGVSSPAFVNGLSGTKAVRFNGSSHMRVGSAIHDSKTHSVAFWVKDPEDGNVFSTISSKYNNWSSPIMRLSMENGMLRYVVSSYYNAYISYRDDNNIGRFSHPAIDDGKWHHVALASDYGVSRYGYWTTVLYIDGKKAGTTAENESNASYTVGTGLTFQISGSGNHNNTDTYSGSPMTVDNFRVYTRCLNADEVKTIYESEK